MPQLDLGSVLGPQGPKGDPGNQGTVGPRGPQGEQGDAGKDATINGVNALTIETGDGLEATMTGSAYNLKLTDKTLNAVRVVPTFTRPNLLDNWYFGRPVDQRSGKIIQQGVNIYADSALKTLIGPAAYACPVVELTSTYAKVQDAKNTSNYYYAAPGDVVRGYTGNWIYTIDRWQLADGNGLLQVQDGSIIFTSANYFFQPLPEDICKLLLGKTLTFSFLYADGTLDTGTCDITSWSGEWTVFLETGNIRIVGIQNGRLWALCTAAGKGMVAAKLELGPTQTLAHQDAAGNWVLNEVPEYGEQLRRCQRYYQVHKAPYWFAKNDDGIYRLTLPIPPMRTVPAVTYDTFGTGTIIADTKNYAEDSVQFYATGVTNYCAVLNLKLSADL